jgi:transcriptional regulator with XRE-family HTH domain
MANQEIREFSARLKKWRKATGMSHHQIAKKSKLGYGTLRKIEKKESTFLQSETRKNLVALLSQDPLVFSGQVGPPAVIETGGPLAPIPSFDEVEKALGMDVGSTSNTPPVKITIGKLEIALRVTED